MIVKGSVKDLFVFKQPTQNRYGEGEFIYRNDWSCFDWAHGDYEMPDKIPYKGIAQCLIGAFFFEKKKEMGIPTTYIGLVDPETNKVLKLPEELKPTNRMRIKVARVIKPRLVGEEVLYEYDKDTRCAVIPLEFIFRFGLPEGSSVFRRKKKGTLDPGLFGKIPEAQVWFGVPKLDYSTKFDPRGDLYDLGKENYIKIAGLSKKEMDLIDCMTRAIAYLLYTEYKRIGMDLWDGKLEYIFAPGDGEREIHVGDVAGTPDEVRILWKGQQWSKEFGRQIYRRKQPEWVNACSEESKRGGDWQARILEKGLTPKHLTKIELDLFSGIYTSIANELWGKSVISSAPTIEEVEKDYKRYIKSLK